MRAIGAGASEDSLDETGLQRVADWIWDLQPPPFPRDRIDPRGWPPAVTSIRPSAPSAMPWTGLRVGQVVRIDEIGTDPERLNSFTPALAERMNTGTGRPGASPLPQDGRLRQPAPGRGVAAGALPAQRLRADAARPAAPPEQRPTVFYRGVSTYDYADLGFVSSGPRAERWGSASTPASGATATGGTPTAPGSAPRRSTTCWSTSKRCRGPSWVSGGLSLPEGPARGTPAAAPDESSFLYGGRSPAPGGFPRGGRASPGAPRHPGPGGPRLGDRGR